MAQRRHDPEQHVPHRAPGASAPWCSEVAENVVHAGIALRLVLAAPALLGSPGGRRGRSPVTCRRCRRSSCSTSCCSCSFMVELLFAVRTTVEKRELVTEPFLVIGVIDSITEIVVLSVEVAGVVGEGAGGEQGAAPGRAAEARG